MKIDASFAEVKERVLRIRKVDSAGRTKEQVDAMNANELKPVRLSDAAKEIAEICAEEHSVYPKVMYRLALKNGVPAGDEVYPSCPLPFDLAQQCGLADKGFKRLNHTATSVGNIVVRWPWITKSVGVVAEDLSVDIEAAKREEAKLLKDGWVFHPSQIRGLPPMTAEEIGYDPLPDEPVEVKKGR